MTELGSNGVIQESVTSTSKHKYNCLCITFPDYEPGDVVSRTKSLQCGLVCEMTPGVNTRNPKMTGLKWLHNLGQMKSPLNTPPCPHTKNRTYSKKLAINWTIVKNLRNSPVPDYSGLRNQMPTGMSKIASYA